MDSEKLKTLVCIIEKGSLSAAAEACGYTPSGISRMLGALEKELGFSLLIRGREGAVATPECLELLPTIYEFIHCGEKCAQAAANIRGLQVGTVIVGTAYSFFYKPVSRAVASFCEKYPGIRIEVVSGCSHELLKKLQSHQLDMCIVSKREGEHRWIPLCEDAMVAWVPNSHPLAEKKAVPMEAFAAEPYIDTYPQEDIDNTYVFQKSGIVPNTRFYTRDSYATWQMVDAGLGISMNNGINGQSWSGNVKILPLRPMEKMELGIACLREMTLAGGAFLEECAGYCFKALESGRS